MEILVATNIRKSYGNTEVLKGIDLKVSKGEFIGIVGPSGAGKSTLLHILGTLDRPDGGSVKILDREVSVLREKQLATFRNLNLGFVFQFHNLLPEFSALENACIPSLIAGKSLKEAEDRAKELLSFLGLAHRIHHKPSQLSGGEQQRASVARALVNRPAIIFADEPSGNLDEKNAKELHELFFHLREKEGQTFVIVTHNKELASQSDRSIWIEDGIVKVPISS